MAQNESTLGQRVVALERELAVNKAIAFILALRLEAANEERGTILGAPLVHYVADTISEGTALLEVNESEGYITLLPRDNQNK